MTETLQISVDDRNAVAPMLSVIVPCYNEKPNVAPLIARLDAALRGIDWEVIYVDDNSPDGTAAEVRRLAQIDPRVRCIRRVGRRGLASAVIEGALSSSAAYVAVIDGDLQHDETRLPAMLAELRTGRYDLAVASRHIEGASNAGLAGRWRHALSDGGIWLAQKFLPVPLTDPMSAPSGYEYSSALLWYALMMNICWSCLLIAIESGKPAIGNVDGFGLGNSNVSAVDAIESIINKSPVLSIVMPPGNFNITPGTRC